jgi:large subunit ribosomal protein L17
MRNRRIILGGHTHRRRLLRQLTASFFQHNCQLVSTITKVKYLQPHIEKLITKVNRTEAFSLANFRYIKSEMHNQISAVKTLYDVAAIMKAQKRPGGYTRVIRICRRKGDNTVMAELSLSPE